MADAQVCSNKTRCPSDEWKGSAITSITQTNFCCCLLTETSFCHHLKRISVSAPKCNSLKLQSKILKINYKRVMTEPLHHIYRYHWLIHTVLLVCRNFYPFSHPLAGFFYSCINIISSWSWTSTPLYLAYSNHSQKNRYLLLLFHFIAFVKTWQSNSYERTIFPLLHKIHPVSFNTFQVAYFIVIHIFWKFYNHVLSHFFCLLCNPNNRNY